jgi:hypothetical protein
MAKRLMGPAEFIRWVRRVVRYQNKLDKEAYRSGLLIVEAPDILAG